MPKVCEGRIARENRAPSAVASFVSGRTSLAEEVPSPAPLPKTKGNEMTRTTLYSCSRRWRPTRLHIYDTEVSRPLLMAALPEIFVGYIAGCAAYACAFYRGPAQRVEIFRMTIAAPLAPPSARWAWVKGSHASSSPRGRMPIRWLTEAGNVAAHFQCLGRGRL